MPNDDHFPITIDVEENHVGKVLRLLDGTPGVVNIHLRMNRNRVPGGVVNNRKVLALVAPKPRVKDSLGTMNDVVGQALSRGSLHYKILGEILHRHGYSPNSLYKALNELKKRKLVKKVAAGTYRLTERGEKKYGLEVQERRAGPPKRLGGVDNSRGLRSFVLHRLAVGTKTHKELMGLIEEAGYVRNNIYTLVPKLIEEGFVHKNNDTYEITEAGREVISNQMGEQPGDHSHTNSGEAS